MPSTLRRNASKRSRAKPAGHEASAMWKAHYFEVNGHKCNPPEGKRIGRHDPTHPMMRLARGPWYLRGR